MSSVVESLEELGTKHVTHVWKRERGGNHCNCRKELSSAPPVIDGLIVEK